MAGVLLGGGLGTAPAQALLLQYLFDDSGTTTANSGTATGGALTLFDAAGNTTSGTGPGTRGGVAADLHLNSGTDVGGTGSAFDGSAATSMGGATGPAATGNRAQGTASVGTLTSFTVQGWFKADTEVGNGAKLFEMSTGTGITVSSQNAGRLYLTVGATTSAGSNASYTTAGDWVFFAVTYDGTATTNNVNFYLGSETDAVSLVSTVSLNGGSASPSGTVTLGNSTGSNSRPFDGLLDDIRLYGATSGTSGALGLAALDQLRSGDLGVVPEPSSGALLLGGAAGLGGTIFSRRRLRHAGS